MGVWLEMGDGQVDFEGPRTSSWAVDIPGRLYVSPLMIGGRLRSAAGNICPSSRNGDRHSRIKGERDDCEGKAKRKLHLIDRK